MANLRQVAQYGLNALLKAGAGKAQCVVTFTDKHEMNVELGEFSLLEDHFRHKYTANCHKRQPERLNQHQ